MCIIRKRNELHLNIIQLEKISLTVNTCIAMKENAWCPTSCSVDVKTTLPAVQYMYMDRVGTDIVTSSIMRTFALIARQCVGSTLAAVDNTFTVEPLRLADVTSLIHNCDIRSVRRL